MKKSLLALAVVAALPGVALAQSSVTISGNIKTGVARFTTDSLTGTYSNYTNITGNPVSSNAGKIKDTAIADGSSRIIISGKEDLGGGLVGVFQVDNRFNGNDGASPSNYGIAPQGTLAGGNTYVGVEGGFGKVWLGNLDVHYGQGTDEFATRATALGASSTSLLDFVGSGAPGATIAVTSRSKNVIRYVTPVMSGFSAQLDYSLAYAGLEGGTNYQTNTRDAVGPTVTTLSPGKGTASHFQLNFAEGPVKAGVSYWDAKIDDVTGSAVAVGFQAYNSAAVATATPLPAGTPAAGLLASQGQAFAVGTVRGLGTSVVKTGENSVKLFGSYNLGFATIGATYDDSKLKQVATDLVTNKDTSRKAYSFSVTAPVGPGTVLFHYTKAGNLKIENVNGLGLAPAYTPTASNNAANNTEDSGATMISLGYDYSLSKRTSLGANYSRINNGKNAAYNFFTGTALMNSPNTGKSTDTSMLYAGIRHAF
jgi:predicted porin